MRELNKNSKMDKLKIKKYLILIMKLKSWKMKRKN